MSLGIGFYVKPKYFYNHDASVTRVINYSTLSNSSTVYAQFFGSIIQPIIAYQIPYVYYFWGKNPPCTIIEYRVFNKFGFFSHFFGLFHQNFPNFLLFVPILSIFPIWTQKPFLMKFGYAGKNYTIRLFHPVRLLKFWYFSTLYVYSVLYVY